MTDIGSSNPMHPTHPLSQSLPSANPTRIPLGQRLDASFDAAIDWLMRCLCRASRGYLCPPDMTQVMYPDEPIPNTRIQECCHEKLPGK
jgi:hypothetical protein